MSIFQVELGRPSDFRFEPQAVPSAAPVMQIYGGPNGALLQTVTLTAEKASLDVVEIVDRHTLRLSNSGVMTFFDTIDDTTLVGRTGDIMGLWFLKAHALAQTRINIQSFDHETKRAHLASPLPENAVGPIGLQRAGELVSAVYTAEIAAGSLGDSVDRGAWYKIEYTIDPDHTGPTDKGSQVFYWSEAGRIRVVRNRFATGLTHTQLAELVPQFASTKPPNRATWQPMIDELNIISMVESYLPSTVYADQVLGEQFRVAHAFEVAHHAARLGLLPNLSPEAAKEMAKEEFSRQAQRLHFVDLDDDGQIDSGELAYTAESRIGLVASTSAQTLQDYADGKRYKPTINNEDDR